MNLMFLDIDGVLNSRKFFTERAKRKCETHLDFKIYDLDPEAVRLLNVLVKDTNAKIVFTSTWRHDTESTIAALKFVGLENAENVIIGRTDKIGDNYCVRGNEILKWIKDHEHTIGYHFNFKSYVIIDDDSNLLYCQSGNFVQVDSKIGLTVDNIEQAIDILKFNKELK
jgi:hypothetical protein